MKCLGVADWPHVPAEIVAFMQVYAFPSELASGWLERNQAIVKKWLDAGVLAKCPIADCACCPTGYSVTERGKVWIKMICSTPFPEKVWFDPRTKEPIPAAEAVAAVPFRR